MSDIETIEELKAIVHATDPDFEVLQLGDDAAEISPALPGQWVSRLCDGGDADTGYGFGTEWDAWAYAADYFTPESA
jgi:hypothetical protein